MLWTIVVKDLKLMLRDRKALLIVLLMPAVLTAILGLSIGKILIGQQISLTPAKVAIVNLDDRSADLRRVDEFLGGSMMQNALSAADRQKITGSLEQIDLERILFQDVLANEQVRKFIQYQVADRSAAEELLRQGKITAMVVIPAGFIYDTFINFFSPFRNPVVLEVVKNPDDTFKGDIVEGILRGFTDTVSAGMIAKNTFLEIAVENNLGSGAYRELEGITRQVLDMGMRDVQVSYLNVTGMRLITGFEYYAAAMAAMFILFVASYGARYLLGERQARTIDRMLLGNVSRSTILAGRFASTFLISYLQILILLLFSSLVFGVWWGRPPDLLVYNLVVALAVAALTVLLSGLTFLANDDRIANVYEAMAIQVMAIVGGSFIPVKDLPAFIGALGRLTPNGNALNGYLQLMQGYRLPDLGGNILSLLIIACVFLFGGITAMRAAKE